MAVIKAVNGLFMRFDGFQTESLLTEEGGRLKFTPMQTRFTDPGL
jgi:hypothetical protein